MPDVLREKHAGRMLIETSGDFRAMITDFSALALLVAQGNMFLI